MDRLRVGRWFAARSWPFEGLVVMGFVASRDDVREQAVPSPQARSRFLARGDLARGAALRSNPAGEVPASLVGGLVIQSPGIIGLT